MRVCTCPLVMRAVEASSQWSIQYMSCSRQITRSRSRIEQNCIYITAGSANPHNIFQLQVFCLTKRKKVKTDKIIRTLLWYSKVHQVRLVSFQQDYLILSLGEGIFSNLTIRFRIDCRFKNYSWFNKKKGGTTLYFGSYSSALCAKPLTQTLAFFWRLTTKSL